MSRRHARLQPARWRAVRRRVLDRDGWRCKACGKAGRMEVDHIKPLFKFPDQDPYDPGGCQTLCRSCHIAKTRRENRRPGTPAERRWWRLMAEYTDAMYEDARRKARRNRARMT